jgi:hypothetical protein
VFEHLTYYFFIMFFSCIENTLVSDKDCSGVIAGDAVVDDCGYCTGGTTVTTFNQYLGCDSVCQGKQFDCTYDPNDDSTWEGACGGQAVRDCNDDCGGTAIERYYCEDTDSDGLLNIESRSLNCIDASIPGNCNPNFDSCLFMDCSIGSIDTMYIGTVINCQGELPSCQEDLCNKFQEYLGDDECDFLDTNCEEFNFDGGDCNLVDCLGTHFSEELCIRLFEAGCTTGEGSWIGDGGCDVGQNDLGLNFNCEEWDYDGGDCESASGRIIYGHKFANSNLNSLSSPIP